MNAHSDHLDPAKICTLPPDDLTERLGWIERAILPDVVAFSRCENARTLELNAAPGLAWKLERWIEAERSCCSGITLEALASDTPGRTRLEIRGIDPDAPIFLQLEARLEHAPPKRRGARIVAALGLGTLGALLVCCVLPLAAVALLGGSVTMLTALDAPVPIAIVAIAIAGATWVGLGRRAGRTSAPENAPCCGGES